MVGRQWRYGTWAVLVVLLMVLAAPWLGHARTVEEGRDYLLVGAATDEPTPLRACTPQMLSGDRQQVTVPAPPEGWSGQPQALDVFNVFGGEVRLAHGDREICGNMHDARTRDSRFRAVPLIDGASGRRAQVAGALERHGEAAVEHRADAASRARVGGHHLRHLIADRLHCVVSPVPGAHSPLRPPYRDPGRLPHDSAELSVFRSTLTPCRDFDPGGPVCGATLC